MSIDKIRESKSEPSRTQGQSESQDGTLFSELAAKNVLEIDNMFNKVISGDTF